MSRRKSTYRSTLVGLTMACLSCGASYAVIAQSAKKQMVDLEVAPAPVAQVIDRMAETTVPLERVLAEKEAKVEASKRQIDAQQREIAALNQQIQSSLLVNRTFDVTDRDLAYPLLPPKLMMSVSTLIGGAVLVNYSKSRTLVQVGGRIDIRVDDLACFLVLLESRVDRARFQFGCEAIPAERAQPSFLLGSRSSAVMK